ncbi:MAG: DUF4248 domain-containing protein [Prevotella sp.]
MNDFKIKNYTKKELALMFFPDKPRAAVRHLMSWIKRNKAINDYLAANGHNQFSKYFTSLEVGVIIHNLGEP